MISLNFLKKNCAKTAARFPHLDQRGNTSGSSVSALFFLCALSACAMAEQTVEQQIDQAIHQHLHTLMNQHANENGWKGIRLTLANTPLTRLQQIAPCTGDIKVSGGAVAKLARQQLTLECTAGTKGWPIKVSSDMQVFLPLVISTLVINRGDTIQRNQLKLQENEITRSPRGFYHRLDQVAGMSAKRRIRAGQIVSPDLIDQPQAVKRGEKVKIVAQRDGISAAMAGEALEKGSVGDVIRVKNLSSEKTIEAKVVEAGVVTSVF